jgi:hypothetical protein
MGVTIKAEGNLTLIFILAFVLYIVKKRLTDLISVVVDEALGRANLNLRWDNESTLGAFEVKNQLAPFEQTGEDLLGLYIELFLNPAFDMVPNNEFNKAEFADELQFGGA